MSNHQLANTILYVTENGCKWRALTTSYGNWQTVYVRMNRWSKNGELQRLFEALQTEGIIQNKQRNKTERYFSRLKRFRRIFTRYDKLDALFAGFILFTMVVNAIT